MQKKDAEALENGKGQQEGAASSEEPKIGNSKRQEKTAEINTRS